MNAVHATPAGNKADVIRTAALKCASLGLPIFTIHGVIGGKCTCNSAHEGCENSIGKHPWGTTFKDATTDPAVINKWFNEHPGCNYAIATGREFNNTGKAMVVVDVDSYKQGATNTINDLESLHGKLTDTATTLTGGGGTHRYYLTEIGKKFNSNFGLNSGVDIKGIGGYVIGPMSMHRLGKRYETEASSDLFEGFPIAELPGWAVEKFGKKEPRIDSPPTAVTRLDVSMEEMEAYRTDLKVIPADDRAIWLDILMALKNRSASEQMFALADEWSRTSDKYNAADMLGVWKSIDQDGGITIKKLSSLADEFRRKTVDISMIATEAPPKTTPESDEWQSPEPIFATEAGSPYPLDALPQLIQDAAKEVQAFAKTPMAMVVCSALGVLSVAAQSLYDVERATKLTGPIGIYFLVIAESGERKTTLDSFFLQPIREHEVNAIEVAKPSQIEFRASYAAWEARKKGLLDRIARDTKNNKNTVSARKELIQLEEEEPTRPRVPRLLYKDVTTEKLVHCLANDWPSGGVIVSEGGTVFGGHAMNKDSQMRTMAAYNELWDGKGIRVDRRTSESFSAEGIRMTLAIQVQEAALADLVAGPLARGIGYLARFMVAWPASTQGTRFYSDPPEHWPSLTLYRKRITDILEAEQPIEDGELKPKLLCLSPAAKRAWVEFSDDIEAQLSADGDFATVRDVASKTADNAVRLAALFHALDGSGDQISEAHIRGASRIAMWHLMESRRFLGGIGTSPAEINASMLNAWLIARCKRNGLLEIPMQYVQQNGPNSMRKKQILDAAIAVLVDLKRVKVAEGKPRIIQLNPALLKAPV